MSSLVDHLAELTRFRDREQADALLADTLAELLQPRVLALHRAVGEPPDRRWLTSVRLGEGPALPPRRPPFERLPRLQAQPAWHACMEGQQPLETPDGVLLPLLVGNQAVGVLELHGTGSFGDEGRRTAQAIVRLYGNFLALLDYGERDALTGLLNRKTFDDSFMHAVLDPAAEPAASGPQDARAELPARYWLAVLDIDHFKRVNDSFGHLIGDEVLLLLAGLMRTSFRFDDRLFRFGGEEFVVLLGAPNEEAAAAVLERLRARVEAFEFPQVGQVTVSIGFTAVRPSDAPTDAYERADRAVYHAKTAGRNRVAGPSTLAAAGLPEEPPRVGQVDLF